MHPTYNDRMQLPGSAESNLGYSAMAAHFSTSTLLPEYIYIHSPHDLRTPQALADMEQMAQRGPSCPTSRRCAVSHARRASRSTRRKSAMKPVRSAPSSKTRPRRSTARQVISMRSAAALTSWRTVSPAFATRSIGPANDDGDDRDAQPGAAAARGNSNNATARHSSAYANSIGNSQTTVNEVVNSAAPMLDALNNSPQCDADPVCRDGRAKLQQLAAAGNSQTGASAQSVLSTVQRLSTLLQSAGADLRSAGINDPAAAQQKIAQMEQGADALADGSKQLAGGVQTLVDQTKQMGLGMNQAAGLLLSIKHDASQPSMAGMYIPPKVLTTTDFKNAAKLFISPDGHSARYLVETKFDPFSTQAMDQVRTILDTARGAQPNTTLSDATVSMVGTTPMYSAMRSYYEHDLGSSSS